MSISSNALTLWNIGINKSLRILMVMEVVEALGKASPKQVLERMADQLSESADDANLKRTIYRDLKELCDAGKLSATTYTPDGNEFSDGMSDDPKNIRIEYSILDQETSSRIRGWRTLESAGFGFTNSSLRKLSWEASRLSPTSRLKDRLNLLVLGSDRTCVLLQLPCDELPCKVVFTRLPKTKSDQLLVSKFIQDEFGNRSVVFFLNDASVSRAVAGQKFGHALLQINSKSEISIRDFDSTSGTAVSKIELEALNAFIGDHMNESTTQLEGSVFFAQLKSVPVTRVKGLSNLPSVLCLGASKVLLHIG